MPFSLLVFRISIRRTITSRLTRHTLCPNDRSDLFACVLCIPLVHNVAERREVAVGLDGIIDVIVDGNEMNARLSEVNLAVIANFQIISSKSRHIFDNDRSDISRVNILYQFLERRTIEIRAGITIVHIELNVAETFLLGILSEHFLLVRDTVALAVQLVVNT